MANQIVVTQSGNVQVSIEPTPNVQVQISRAAITTLTDVPTANFANYAGNVVTAAQPNITSLGTLTGLTVSGNSTVTNLNVTGNLAVGNLVANSANYANFANISNTANSVAVANVVGIGNIAITNYDGNGSNILHGNGYWGPEIGPQSVANANYANFAGTAYSVSGANVSGEVANAAYANAANTANLATYATTANSVAGANVSGTVANATYADNAGNATIANSANSVAVANVSGIGNIATVNLDGNASNVLFGNGIFSPIPTVSNVANANYANFAGTAYSVSGSNVSGEVANANYASYANIANSANSVAVANVSGIGNIATVNLDGSSSNVLYGNGVFAPESTSIANANYANFAGTAYSVSGANVSGEVANANFASYANVSNVANSVAVANVVGIGNIATVNLDGSSSNVLYGNGQFATISIPSGTSISNGTSNVNIPVANGAVFVSVNGNANVTNIDGNGTISINPYAGGYNNLISLRSYGRSGNVGGQRLLWTRYRGNSTANLSVEPGDSLGEIIWLGYNGTGLSTSRVARISANVDGSYIANTSVIPIGLSFEVGNSTATSNHQFYANGNVTFAQYVNATGFAGDGGNLSNITGSNVSGQVSYAAVANSVAVANVSGIGNIATVNLDGSSSNVLYGNGVFAPESTSIANANYANFAGQVVDNTQSNITQTGNLVNLTVADSANVTGTIQQLAPNTITIATSALQNTAYDLTTIYGETSNLAEPGQRAIIRARGNVSSPSTAVVSDIGARDRVYFYNGTTNALAFATSVTLSNLNSNSNAYSTGASYNVSVGAPSGDQGNANANSAFNLMQFNQNGQLVLLPGSTSTVGTGLQMFSYGQNTNLAQSQGITMAKARGNRDANLSVNPNDTIGRIIFQSHNGNSFVTNRLPIIRATVDGSYLANTANVPAGFQMVVCDNTTSYTHNFYANSYTTLSGGLTTNSLNTGDISSGNINAYLSGISAGNTFNLSLDNNSTQAILQSTYNNANIQTGSWTSWRHRGTSASPLPVQAGDEISKFQSVVRADSGNFYYAAADQAAVVISNDGVGNVATDYRIRVYNSGSKFSVMAPKLTVADSNDFGANATIYANGYIDTIGTVSAANVNVTANGFMKLASYTASALNAITGSVGQIASVTNSTPGGMLAYWDTTNTRWSYVHDNSAV